MTDPADNLLDRILAQTQPPDDAEKQRAERAISAAIRHGLAAQAGMVIPGDAEGTIRRWQAEIDEKITIQLRAIMHHPAFQCLEATWRGLNYLVQHTETDEGLKIKVLNTAKPELAQSTAAAIRLQLDRNEPVRLLVADFEFSRRPDDITILTAVGSVAEAVRTPLLAAASPVLFDLKDYSELRLADSEETLQRFDAAWAEFRDSPAAAAVTMTLPRVLARPPYGAETAPVEEFAFEEISGQDTTQYVWMNAGWVYAATVTAAVVRGGTWNGQAEELSLHTFDEADGERVSRSTEALVPDSWVFELSVRGFAPLVQSGSAYYATFIGGPGNGREVR
jgi:type VI secretion system protein ImpC